jgi:hypothetical protein
MQKERRGVYLDLCERFREPVRAGGLVQSMGHFMTFQYVQRKKNVLQIKKLERNANCGVDGTCDRRTKSGP